MNSDQSTRNIEQKQEKKSIIEEFLDTVFHTQFADDEHITLWASKRPMPGFPKNEEDFLDKVSRATIPLSCYFGTSTMRLDGGRLLNRQELFRGFYVVVLDDIGTGSGSKISPDDLADALGAPTYRIESSPGNFQFGYVLTEPIRDLELAKTFIRVITEKAGTDIGGCSATKLVRMPCGVNLKPQYDGFECRLESLNPDRFWTPEELLGAVNAGITWDEMQAGVPVGGRLDRHRGTTAHRTTPVYHSNLAGIVDPVYEWLVDEGMLRSEGGEWVDILCPWRADHSEGGGDTARYAPLGTGSQPERRGFLCFHAHCRDEHNTPKFLAWVTENGGPRTAINHDIEQLIARYAFVTVDDSVIDMMSNTLTTFPNKGFKNKLAGDVFIPDADADSGFKAVNKYTLWSKNKHRQIFDGRRHVVGGPRVVPNEGGGDPNLNTWTSPEWGTGPFDLARVQPFIEFIQYLMPDPGDAKWFLDHLASKAKSPFYRGPGVIMSTPKEKAGRGTLCEVIENIWCVGDKLNPGITLTQLETGAAAADWNAWIKDDWYIVAEAKETNMTMKKHLTRYEGLKGIVDPAASRIMHREKYQKDYMTKCYGSTIICSQHADVVVTDIGCTRFKWIRNTVNVWSHDKFIEFYAWLTAGPEQDIWRWLLKRNTDHINPFARQEEMSHEDELKIALSHMGPSDKAVRLCISFAETHTMGAVFITEFISWLNDPGISGPLRIDGRDDILWYVKKELQNKTRVGVMENEKPWRPSIGKKQRRIRTTVNTQGLTTALGVSSGDAALMRRICEFDMEELEDQFIAYGRKAIEEDG